MRQGAPVLPYVRAVLSVSTVSVGWFVRQHLLLWAKGVDGREGVGGGTSRKMSRKCRVKF